MADWGAGWRQAGAAVADAVDIFQRNQQISRQEAAERARQLRQENLESLRMQREEDRYNNEILETFVGDDGSIQAITRGQVQKGVARLPEGEMRRRKAAQQAEAAKMGLEQDNLRAQIDMRESAAERNRAQAEKARRPSESGSGGRSNADIAAARSYFNNLISEKDKDGKRVRTPAQAEEEVAARYGEEIAQAAFPNRANRIGPAAEMLGKVGQFASDVGSRAAKYLGLSLQ